jgi:two-component system, OmpR family, response regulator ChvI
MRLNKRRTKLLIVDDEIDLALTFQKVLQENGFEVDSFNDPILALQRFKPHYYDLLILDIKMPAMNGFELYRNVRKIDDSVKVCFLTALRELRDYDQYRKEVSPKLGERYFVSKPIQNEELIIRVNEMMMA